MILNSIKERLENQSIFYSEDTILNKPTVIGYEKKFRWAWLATQLNTFIVATDLGNETITPELIKAHLKEAFTYAKKNYTGWPRGFQSGLGVISVLVSTDIDSKAQAFCEQLSSGKKWAGFAIPVCIHATSGKVYSFKEPSIWGMIYFPHFRKLIEHNLKGLTN